MQEVKSTISFPFLREALPATAENSASRFTLKKQVENRALFLKNLEKTRKIFSKERGTNLNIIQRIESLNDFREAFSKICEKMKFFKEEGLFEESKPEVREKIESFLEKGAQTRKGLDGYISSLKTLKEKYQLPSDEVKNCYVYVVEDASLSLDLYEDYFKPTQKRVTEDCQVMINHIQKEQMEARQQAWEQFEQRTDYLFNLNQVIKALSDLAQYCAMPHIKEIQAETLPEVLDFFQKTHILEEIHGRMPQSWHKTYKNLKTLEEALQNRDVFSFPTQEELGEAVENTRQELSKAIQNQEKQQKIQFPSTSSSPADDQIDALLKKQLKLTHQEKSLPKEELRELFKEKLDKHRIETWTRLLKEKGEQGPFKSNLYQYLKGQKLNAQQIRVLVDNLKKMK